MKNILKILILVILWSTPFFVAHAAITMLNGSGTSSQVFATSGTGLIISTSSGNNPAVHRFLLVTSTINGVMLNGAKINITTSSDTNIHLRVTTSSNTLIFTPVWQGILGIGRGGTATSTTPNNGQLLIGNGSGYTVGNLIQGSNVLITNSTGTITITVTSTPAFSSISLTNPLAAIYGGTGTSTYSRGDILVAQNSSTLVRLPVGTDGQVLMVSSSAPLGIAWVTLSSSPTSSPTVTTNSAASIASTSVTFNGLVNPNGLSTNAWFRYSTTNPSICDNIFGTRVPDSTSTSIGSGTSSIAYSNSVGGLSASTTYYYCALAHSNAGTGFGNVISFNTLFSSKHFQVDTGGSLTTSLDGYYRMEDANDFYGGNDLTNTGSVTFSTGKVSNAADFGSGNTTKRLSSSRQISGSFSISVWAKITSNPSFGTSYNIAVQGEGSGTKVNHIIRYANESGTMKIYFERQKQNVGNGLVTTSTDVSDGTWHHYVYTYDGSTLEGWMDGISQGNASTSGDGSGGYIAGRELGGNGGDTFGEIPTTGYLSGMDDEVGFWNKKLSNQEISDLYNGGSGQTMTQ